MATYSLDSVSRITTRVTPTTNGHLVKQNLRQCSCGEEGNVVGQFEDWAILFKCPSSLGNQNCVPWVSCFRCATSQIRFTTMAQLKRHRKKFHAPQHTHDLQQSEASMSVEATEDNDAMPYGESVDDSASSDNTHQSDMHASVVQPVVFDPITDLFLQWEDCENPDKIASGRPESSLFFLHQHTSVTTTGGVEYLVKRSHLQRDINPSELRRIEIPLSHVELQLKIANLAYMTTKANQQLLADILAACHRVGFEDGNASAIGSGSKPYEKMQKKAHTWSTNIPETSNEMRKLYLEGRHAIVPNLPHPPILENIPSHAHLSIIDCIEDYLAHSRTGQAIEAITAQTLATTSSVSRRSQSQKAKEIVDGLQEGQTGKAVAFALTFWSDDAETNTFSKMNRNSSIWVKTMSICTVLEAGQHLHATYPIAVGGKKDCHDPVEQFHQKEIRELTVGDRSYYVGSRKMNVIVHPRPLAVLQDQPEKRSANKLALGNSAYHARWGWSADHNKLFASGKLLPCSHCVANMKLFLNRTIPVMPGCDSCLNFDVASSDSGLGSIPKPVNYPDVNSDIPGMPNWVARTDTIQGEERLLPFKITYAGLKAAVEMAHYGFCYHDWSSQNVEVFLRVEGMNVEYIEKVKEHAFNVFALNQARQSNSCSLQEILAHQARNKELYEQCPFSSNWERDGLSLLDTIDAPMHLIFLGIVKSVLLKCQEWLVAQAKNAAFIRDNAKILDTFLSMSIDWLHLLPYKGKKFGGYVSENFLALGRIMKWFFQNIGESMPDPNADAPPVGLSQKKWLAKHNRHWLMSRGLPQEGRASELSDRVAAYLRQGGDCPKEIPIPVLELSHVTDVIFALSDMLECLMDTHVLADSPQRARVLIQWFLFKYNILDEELRKERIRGSGAPASAPEKEAGADFYGDDQSRKEKPDIVAKYNFMCLMNLPLVMQTYGPIRNLWEGGPRGEGFLRVVKPLVTQGLKLNWQSHLLKKLLRSRALDILLEPFREQGEGIKVGGLDKNTLRLQSREFHRYDSLLQLQTAVDQKMPVSVVLLEKCSGEVTAYSVVEDYETMVQIELCLDSPTEKFGLFYYRTNTSQELTHWEDLLLDSGRGDARGIRLGYAVILPLINKANNDENRWYAVVSSNWKSMSPTTPLKFLVDSTR